MKKVPGDIVIYTSVSKIMIICVTVPEIFWPKHRQLSSKTCSQKFDLHMQFIIFLKTFCMCVGMCTCDTTPLLKGSNHTEGNAEVGGSRNLLLFSNDVKSCST